MLNAYSFLSSLLIISIVEGSKPSIVCKVKETSSGEDVSCQFPFILNGEVYHNCTTVQDPDQKPWCSTRVTDREIHIGQMGYWGHCSQSCLQHQDGENKIFEDYEEEFVTEETVCTDCRNFRDCSWSFKLLNYLRGMSSNDPARQNFINFLKSQTCGNKGDQSVCCGTSTKPPPVTVLPDIEDKSLGTWKPKAEFQECGISTNAGFIFGGEDSKLGEFPFMALLGFDSPLPKCAKTIFLCGGALINKHYVLTAAHCLSDPNAPLREIVLGEHDISKEADCSQLKCPFRTQKRKPAKIILHEKWDRVKFTKGYDIALVRLDKPVVIASESPQNVFVSPVCLPWSTSDAGRNISAGDKTTVAGWGKVTNDRKETQDNYCNLGTAKHILQKLNVDVVSHKDCDAAYSAFSIKDDQQLCSGGVKGEDSCNGDSGGPLVYKANSFSDTPMFQVGVVSFGTRFCGIEKPGVYTRVEHFLPWISKHLEP